MVDFEPSTHESGRCWRPADLARQVDDVRHPVLGIADEKASSGLDLFEVLVRVGQDIGLLDRRRVP